jgi:hypothetical protein
VSMTVYESVAFDALRGLTCHACGREKQRKRFFCHECYFSLPLYMREALHTHILKGGAKVYFVTLAFIEQRAQQKQGRLF